MTLKQRIALLTALLGLLGLLGLATIQAVQAIECGPSPTWGCIKCKYHPSCGTNSPAPNENKNQGLVELEA
ncbi:MAG: hypothetical protein HY421_00175 [Candidatus Kerfeldbacteria bacterium]|nr:hypothetical protein [Candidatus Kerfeldbacteria bacterium]